jgi:hypothetical protein
MGTTQPGARIDRREFFFLESGYGPIEMRLCTYKTATRFAGTRRGLASGSGRGGKPGFSPGLSGQA